MQSPSLVRARFARPDAGAWLLAGMSVLLFVASVKFLVVDHAYNIAQAPALGGVAFGVVALAFFLRAGTFTLSARELVGKRRAGGAFQLAIDDITAVELRVGPPSRVTVRSRDGRVRRLQRVAPISAGGAIWFLVHHREHVPEGATLEDPGMSMPPGVQSAGRALMRGGRVEFQDRGLVVSLESGAIYLPTTATSAPAGLGEALALVAHVVVSRELRMGDAPDPSALPMRGFIAAVLASDLPEPEKHRRLVAVAERHAGGSVETNGPAFTAAALGGYEVVGSINEIR